MKIKNLPKKVSSHGYVSRQAYLNGDLISGLGIVAFDDVSSSDGRYI